MFTFLKPTRKHTLNAGLWIDWLAIKCIAYIVIAVDAITNSAIAAARRPRRRAIPLICIMPHTHRYCPRSFIYLVTSTCCFPSSAVPQLFCCALFSFLVFCLFSNALVTNIKANLNNNKSLQHVMNNSWWKILFSPSLTRSSISVSVLDSASTFSFAAI